MPWGKCNNKRYWFIDEYDYDVLIEMIQYSKVALELPLSTGHTVKLFHVI